ncbi:hypothetical protein KOR34_48470 [Posidoniimonas corsicana]|uniref:Ppx/GppA phosphatase family protein n=1 Tax=Posidoniimonas corsicana TaxID=1938618 RepID=A0A5C5UWQ4_9BACT|nr:hypothetical protein [Posidoniimonas corsicana]TWT30289.1 hypothetical protein KOR34_48470 [Posidoniimonas corsicana]
MVRLSLVLLLACFSTAYGQRFGGIEIGAKGVKWVAIDLELGDARNPVTIVDSGDENTTLSALEGPSFNLDALGDTIQTVGGFYRRLHEELQVPEHQIFIVVSSGLPKAENLQALKDGVAEFTKHSLDVLSVEEEVRLGICGLCLQEQDRLGEALVIDVGSGNTKGGYLVPAAFKKREAITTFHLPGTVTLTTAVETIAADRHVDFCQASLEARHSVLKPDIDRQLQRHEDLESRRLVYMNGGVVWALSTFLHPEMLEYANVPLRLDELHQIRDALRKANGEYPTVDASLLNAAATQEISIVKKVFTPENLMAGSEILCTLGETLDFEDRAVYFVRNGRVAWLLGYVSAKGQESQVIQ